jgi:hypothetical protein
MGQLIADWMILGLLAAEVVLLSRLDRRRFGTWVTPFTVLGYPYAAVSIAAYFVAPMFDFVPLYMGSVVVWMIGLFLVWSAGFFLAWGVLDMRLAPSLSAPRFFAEPANVDDESVLRFAVPLAWAIMPVMLYGVFASVRAAGGWEQIGSIEFRDAYSFGLPAHAVVLGTLLVIVLIGLYRSGRNLIPPTIAMLLVFLILGRVKGTILQAIIGGLAFRMMRGQFHLTFKKVAIVLLSTYVVFNVVYLIGMSVFTSDDPFNPEIYQYLGRHYLFYLFAGVLSYSEALRGGIADVGGDWQAIFGPFINLFRAVLGGRPLLAAGSTHEKGMNTDLLSTASATNVYTLFGTLHLYLGALGACLYVVVMGLLCYGFLIVVKRKSNAWITASYCLIAAQLAFGFFELYFWLLTSYEVIALGVILAAVTRWRLRPLGHGYPVAG